MRVLYAATDQVIPGQTGGSVHTLEVARGLAARGHEVHTISKLLPGSQSREERDGFTLHRIRWNPAHRFFRFRAFRGVLKILDDVRPEVLMERYYNFGGEGIRAAHLRGVPSLLEVNSPAIDTPGSLKSVLDALTLVRPMRRYREDLCRKASALVSPLLEVVPPFAREKTERIQWGANVDAFHPRFRSERFRRELGLSDKSVLILFSGSFRPWHGVHVLEAAAKILKDKADLFFLFVGGGRPRPARGFRGVFLGSLPYESMPEIVASADLGVAPYDTSRLSQLRLGFYWSPLKIFEYMASGLPTLTVPLEPLKEIVRPDLEGAHTREGDPEDLAMAISRLATDGDLRRDMGRRARARVVERYSWAKHCERLEAVLKRIVH